MATSEHLEDFRKDYVTTKNGKVAHYYCVRVTPNGRDIHQVPTRTRTLTPNPIP